MASSDGSDLGVCDVTRVQNIQNAPDVEFVKYKM